MGLRKCGAKFHGDSGPEKPYSTDLNQYRPETHLATGGVWEKEKLWGLGFGSSRYKVPMWVLETLQVGWEKVLWQAPATAIRMINHVIYRLHVFLRPMSPEE